MPLYEYSCEKCDKSFEILQMGNKKVKCPECGSTKLNKLFSTFASSSSSSSSGAGVPSPAHGGGCGTSCCGMR